MTENWVGAWEEGLLQTTHASCLSSWSSYCGHTHTVSQQGNGWSSLSFKHGPLYMKNMNGGQTSLITWSDSEHRRICAAIAFNLNCFHTNNPCLQPTANLPSTHLTILHSRSSPRWGTLVLATWGCVYPAVQAWVFGTLIKGSFGYGNIVYRSYWHGQGYVSCRGTACDSHVSSY